jgi:hypothetical protein
LFVGRLVGCGVGFGVGCFVGLNVGEVDIVGDAEGRAEGTKDGLALGSVDGCTLGEVDSVGVWLGKLLGATLADGFMLGSADGDVLNVGWIDGELLTVGWVEGRSEGWVEGTSDGSDVFLSASNWAINAAARCASSLLCNSIPPMTPRTVKAPMEMTIDPPTTASLVFEHLHVVDTMVVFR